MNSIETWLDGKIKKGDNTMKSLIQKDPIIVVKR